MSFATETSNIPSVPTHYVMPETYCIHKFSDVSSCDVPCTDTDFDGSDDHSVEVSNCDPDLQYIVESNNSHLAHNSQMLSWIFTAPNTYKLLKFNIPQNWINVSDVFHRVIKSCLEKLLLPVEGGLKRGYKRQFIEALVQICRLIARFLILYRVRSQFISPQPLQKCK
jgi:hypothetical protein